MKTEATHYIECFEHAGRGRKRRLFQECILLGYVDENRAKVRVLRGIRGGNGGNLAYINKNRLVTRYVENKGEGENLE